MTEKQLRTSVKTNFMVTVTHFRINTPQQEVMLGKQRFDAEEFEQLGFNVQRAFSVDNFIIPDSDK